MTLFKNIYDFEELKLILNDELKPAIPFDDEILLLLIKQGKIPVYHFDKAENHSLISILPDSATPTDPSDFVDNIVPSLYKAGYFEILKTASVFKREDIQNLINSYKNPVIKLAKAEPPTEITPPIDKVTKRKTVPYKPLSKRHGSKGNRLISALLESWHRNNEGKPATLEQLISFCIDSPPQGYSDIQRFKDKIQYREFNHTQFIGIRSLEKAFKGT